MSKTKRNIENSGDLDPLNQLATAKELFTYIPNPNNLCTICEEIEVSEKFPICSECISVIRLLTNRFKK